MSLFLPLRLGALELPNRIVMAPLGRSRAEESSRAPTPSVARYYAQRASAGLIITEATHVAPDSVSRPGSPGIHTDAQVAAWRRVTDAVHQAGGRIVQQLYHLGRKADPTRLPGGGLPKAPSPIAAQGQFSSPLGAQPFPVPRPVTADEIGGLIEDFRLAARHARRAGFDGVEVHAANGFLIDQFLRDGANQRQDEFGGAIERRARFLLAVVDAAAGEFGPERVGVRISPHSISDGTNDSSPKETFGFVARALSARRVAYLHLIESVSVPEERRLARILRREFGGPLVLCGGLDRASAERAIQEGRADLVAFGTAFIANPDLVERLRRHAPWNEGDPATYYSGGDRGYVDYPVLALDAGGP